MKSALLALPVLLLAFAAPASAQQTTPQVAQVTIAAAAVQPMAAAMAKAQSPEEAAKFFAKAASAALGQVFADVLSQTLSQVALATPQNSAIVGWQKYIQDNGVALALHWPTPALMSAGTLPVASYKGTTVAPAGSVTPAGFGGSISITIGGTF